MLRKRTKANHLKRNRRKASKRRQKKNKLMLLLLSMQIRVVKGKRTRRSDFTLVFEISLIKRLNRNKVNIFKVKKLLSDYYLIILTHILQWDISLFKENF